MSTREELERQLAEAETDEQKTELQSKIDDLPEDQGQGDNGGDGASGGDRGPPPPSSGRGTGQGSGPPLSMTTGPTLTQLGQLKYKPQTTAVATRDQINYIAGLWQKNGVPQDKLALAAWDLARHCADVGSSDAARMVDYSPAGQNITRQTLAGLVKTVCTLRQFCMFYAKVVWNMMLKTEKPPASWQKWEYRYTERYAAFDFFQGVSNEAALNPTDGLFRQPTDAEMAASHTNRYVHVHRAGQGSSDYLTLATEVHKGRLQGTRVEYLEAP
ncbi:putative coat protein [Potexvirus nesignambrosiae]|uniref:Putative coat protein n=2 Tax=Potexvirus nesignambrosiae TaxID=1417304 RepID=V5V388_9VIRU|nr:putative coat protein [Ambrosia asymptomatic virus 1]AHB87037.1 putative coat protein [Ambrosia asymptomatic virus 1]